MRNSSRVTISKILKAARTLFIEKQYADVTLKEIATVVGVTKGALYHHFANKEELYLNMMFHYLDEVKECTQTTAEITRGLSCRERLYLSLLHFLQLPEKTIKVVSLVRRDGNIFKEPARSKLIRAYQSSLPELLEKVIAEGMANGEIVKANARLLSWQYIALVEVSIHPYSRQVLGESEAVADFVVTTLFDGIKNEDSQKGEHK